MRLVLDYINVAFFVVILMIHYSKNKKKAHDFSYQRKKFLK